MSELSCSKFGSNNSFLGAEGAAALRVRFSDAVVVFCLGGDGGGTFFWAGKDGALLRFGGGLTLGLTIFFTTTTSLPASSPP